MSWFFIIVGILCVVVITFLITASVTKRHLTGDEIIATINIAEFCLVIIAFLGLSWTQIKRGHVAAEFFVSHFPKRGQRITQVATTVASLFFAVILVWASWVAAMRGYHNKELVVAAGIIMTMWPIRFVLPLGFALYIFTLLFDLKDSLVTLVKGEEE